MKALQELLVATGQELEKVYEQVKAALSKMSTKITPHIIDDIVVNDHGVCSPINQIAAVTALSARALCINPWDKNQLASIEKAVVQSNHKFTRNTKVENTGEAIIITLPTLTEESRKEQVKELHTRIEQAHIATRQVRSKAINELKKLEKQGFSKDDIEKGKKELESLKGDYKKKIETQQKDKEKEIMQV